MSDIGTLTEQIINFRDERDWKQFHTIKDMVMALLIESGELAENFQWKTEEEISKLSEDQRIDIAHELSDVLYWTLLLAHDLDIDLVSHFQEKMKINASKYPVDKARGNKSKYTDH